MNDIPVHFLAEARKYLSSSYLPKIEKCLDTLSDEDVWWRANPQSNSIGNLLLHLIGSTRMWIITGVNGVPVERDRDREFNERGIIPRAELLAALKGALTEVDQVLANANTERLLERRSVRGHNVTALEAVFHAVEHFAMHTGQIIVLAKMRSGKDLELPGYNASTAQQI